MCIKCVFLNISVNLCRNKFGFNVIGMISRLLVDISSTVMKGVITHRVWIC